MSGNQAHSGIKQQRVELDDMKDTVKNWKVQILALSGEKRSIDPLIVSAEHRPRPVSSEQKLCGGARVSTVIAPRHKRGENCTCGCIRQERWIQCSTHPSVGFMSLRLSQGSSLHRKADVWSLFSLCCGDCRGDGRPAALFQNTWEVGWRTKESVQPKWGGSFSSKKGEYNQIHPETKYCLLSFFPLA